MSTTTDPLEMLRSVPLFQGLSKRELKTILNSAKQVEHAAGHTIVEEGARGVGFHLILEGEASVLRKARKLARLGPGDFFGEMSLLDGGPRSATVKAETNTKTLALSSWDFHPLIEKNPSIALRLLEVLSGRLRAAQESITD
jgi:CRP-like cAMP-binding protein